MKHLKENNETYFSHLLFAGKVGLTLMFRGFVFILHAIFPICNVPKKWNILATLKDLEEWHQYVFKRFNK